MSDNPIDAVFSPPVAPGQEPPKEATQQQPGVTREDLEAKISELQNRLDRFEQSLADKTALRIENRLKKWQKQVEAQGVSMTPELLEQGRRTLALKELDSVSDEDAVAKPVQKSNADPNSTGVPQSVIDQTNAAMRELQKQYGYVLTENDPEFYEIPWDGNPKEFLEKYEEAQQSAMRRAGRTPPKNASASAVSRSPTLLGGSVGPSNPIENIVDPRELFRLGFEQMPKK